MEEDGSSSCCCDSSNSDSSSSSEEEHIDMELVHEKQQQLQSIITRRKTLAARMEELKAEEKQLLCQQQDLEEEMKAVGCASMELATSLLPDEVYRGNVNSYSESNSNTRFLQPGEEQTKEKVILASYPRSGNSLLRYLIESVSGIITGSDSSVKRALIQQLVKMGMKGEGIVDDRVWCIKTHYPERLGYCAFEGNRAIVLVRNPFDSIISYFNMVLTQTHTESIQETEYLKYASIFNEFIKEEIMIWKQFYQHWLKVKIPFLFVRYEDLTQHRRKTLTKLVRFLYKSKDLSGSEFEAKITELCQSLPTEADGIYKARSMNSQSADTTTDTVDMDEGGSNRIEMNNFQSGADLLQRNNTNFLYSLKYYSHEQIQFILTVCKTELTKFGYFDSFPAEFGLPYIRPSPAQCLVTKLSNDAARPPAVVCNSKLGLRQRTPDDPYGRGFGTRWKSRINLLPPPRLIDKSG